MKISSFFKIILFIASSAFTVEGISQTTPKPTSTITINGKVKAPKTFTIGDIKKLSSHNIGDVVITNHRGEAKGTAKELSGVLLTQVLEQLELDAESPKVLSEYYFSCIASDAYRVVFSWNELFNTAVGNSVYIVTGKDGKPIEESDESILMISTQDTRTGRRFVKNLETILVGRAR